MNATATGAWGGQTLTAPLEPALEGRIEPIYTDILIRGILNTITPFGTFHFYIESTFIYYIYYIIANVPTRVLVLMGFGKDIGLYN